jgi:Ca-activated chloride channel family protein
MSFLWPLTLWLFAPIAALPLAYVWLLRRRKRALKFSNLSLLREAVGGRPSFRRHLPPILLFVAVALMTFALARPTAIVTLPSERSIIMLAIDVSGSMRAHDVEPSRIEAAQKAARTFVADQPRNVRIGVVTFSGSAMISQMPTLSREDVLASLDNLRLQRRTAVGSGIVASLQAIFPEISRTFSLSSLEPQAAALGDRSDQVAPPPVPPGSFSSAIIILLTDGRTNAGVPPLDAAHMAADRGVRVFTVGFGNPGGANEDVDGGFMRLQLDEEALRAIAEITHAKYFNAQSSEDLEGIYKGLSAQFVAETKRTELTGLVAAPALFLLLIAGVLSLVWSNRLT